VVLGARRAPLEVRLHAGDSGVGVPAGELDLHVTVELLEALLAGQLRAGRPEQPAE